MNRLLLCVLFLVMQNHICEQASIDDSETQYLTNCDDIAKYDDFNDIPDNLFRDCPFNVYMNDENTLVFKGVKNPGTEVSALRDKYNLNADSVYEHYQDYEYYEDLLNQYFDDYETFRSMESEENSNELKVKEPNYSLFNSDGDPSSGKSINEETDTSFSDTHLVMNEKRANDDIDTKRVSEMNNVNFVVNIVGIVKNIIRLPSKSESNEDDVSRVENIYDPKRGAETSFWGLILLMMGLFLMGMGTFFLCFPCRTKQEAKKIKIIKNKNKVEGEAMLSEV